MSSDDTVEPYIDIDGRVHLYVKPRYGMASMEESLGPGPWFAVAGSTYVTDGCWWDTPQPLSQDSMSPLTRVLQNGSDDHYLVATWGPGVLLGNVSAIPSRYRVITTVPSSIRAMIRTKEMGSTRFTADKIKAFELDFWTKPRLKTAWKYIQEALPRGIPSWEMEEARQIFENGARMNWAARSLASVRRHYFNQRKNYYTYVLGQEESEDERRQRLEYDRDARVMAAFYRAFTGNDGRAVLLRKSKRLGARRLVIEHDREYQELMDRINSQYTTIVNQVDTWIDAAYGRSN